MFQGRNLSELAVEIERQARSKRDLVAPSAHIEMRMFGEVLEATERGGALDRAVKETEQRRVYTPKLMIKGALDWSPMTEHAQQQLAQWLGVPWAYWKRMSEEAPLLLDENANEWLLQGRDRRMVRTLDGRVRAVLSDKYRRIDHYDLAQIVLPEIADLGGQVCSSEITERRLYLKVKFPRLQRDVERFKRPGSHERIAEPVVPGFVWSNSEIGLGANELQAFVEVLVCSNGLIIPQFSSRKRHVGRRVGGGGNGDGGAGAVDLSDEEGSYWSDETKKADDKALALKMRDAIRATADEARIGAIAQQIVDASAQPVEGDPAKAVEVLGDALDLSEGERGGVLSHLIRGGDLSRWGMCQAVTRAAGDDKVVQGYDRATELERAGGDVLAMAVEEWERIAGAK